jgi:hypothetical protein
MPYAQPLRHECHSSKTYTFTVHVWQETNTVSILILVPGGLAQLKSILQTGSEEEKSHTMRVFLELTASDEVLAIVKVNFYTCVCVCVCVRVCVCVCLFVRMCVLQTC